MICPPINGSKNKIQISPYNKIINSCNNIYKIDNSNKNKNKTESIIEKKKKYKEIENKRNKLLFFLFENKDYFIKKEEKKMLSDPNYKKIKTSKSLNHVILKKYIEIKNLTNKMMLEM